MKTLNFWRTLFLSMLAVTAFVACTDDDEEDLSVIPEITVNGAAEASVAHDLSEGYTDAVKVVSSGPWTLAFENEGDNTWCTPSVNSGNGGETELKFFLAAATESRQAVVKLTAYGEVMGYPVPRTVTITVMQNAGGSTEIATNVKTVRGQLTFEQEATTISESLVVTGICVSDVEGNNINNKSIMLADNTTEPGAGLFIRFNEVNTSIKMGNIVSVELKGGKSQSYYGTFQVNGVSTAAVEILDSNDNTPAPIAVTDPSKLIEYQSQYVSVYSQPVESVRGQAYYNVDSGYANINFETPNGGAFQLSFNSYSSSWAKNVTIPANSGNIKGCVSINNNAGNVSPRNADDLADMTQELFTVESTSTTIDQITAAGSYKVENVTVVATNLQGFVIADNTGAFYVNRGNDGVVPELGKVITIEGTVGTFGGMLQFDKDATVTETGSVEVTYPEATEVTVDNLQSIVDAKKVVYVKSTGKLIKSSNYYNWNFGFTPTGTANIGATVYPDATKLGLEELVNQNVVIEGYYVYTTGSGARFSVVVTSITKGEGGDTPDPTPTEVTIGEIKTAGDYKTTGVVVARGSKAYIIADETGAMMVYHNNNERTVGEKITIEGAVTIYNATSTPQFSNAATVTVVSNDNQWAYNPEVLDGAGMEALSKVTPPVCKEVQFEGALSFSGNNNQYANVKIDGTTVQGSIKNIDNATIESLSGKNVVVKGYFIGTSVSGGTTYDNVLPYSVEEVAGETPDPAEPAITGVNPDKLTWAAAETDAKTITVTGVELADLTAALSGANADKWTKSEVTVAQDGTTATITVTPVAANESETDYAAELTFTLGTITKGATLIQTKPAGQGGGEELTTYTWTMESGQIKQAGGAIVGVGTPAMDWTSTAAGYIGWDSNNNKGVQIGSSKKPEAKFELATSNFSGKIASIVVNSAFGSGGDGKLSVFVGGTQIGETVSLVLESTDYTFNLDTPAEGEIKIVLEATAQAMYIKAVGINTAK